MAKGNADSKSPRPIPSVPSSLILYASTPTQRHRRPTLAATPAASSVLATKHHLASPFPGRGVMVSGSEIRSRQQVVSVVDMLGYQEFLLLVGLSLVFHRAQIFDRVSSYSGGSVEDLQANGSSLDHRIGGYGKEKVLNGGTRDAEGKMSRTDSFVDAFDRFLPCGCLRLAFLGRRCGLVSSLWDVFLLEVSVEGEDESLDMAEV
ncbi:hypothetical protein ZIOFF_060323 [Zingiber officinale]|uniref:Uncharacterized protein n=1 Tax=Zingiber officinale TaxID=94328 RepID=A0A8J5F8F5_ZINOF|nr:hypothetical protein ZIOFF_060323 [Zingiber officinale]